MHQKQQLLFGVYFDALRMEDVVARCRTALLTRSRVLLGVLNAAKVVNLRSDELLRNSLIECDLLLADGQSIVWASRLLGRPLPERVAGIDLFDRLLTLAHSENRSIYLLGAKPEVLAALETRLLERFPGLRIAGSHHGYFDAGDSAKVAADIRESGADMLFLGMVSPKKEIFLASFGPSLGVSILHGVGGSFDVLAGYTKRAPASWQRSGMEWAYRVLQEPQRLWWRYLRTNTQFVLLTALELLRPAHAFKPTAARPSQAIRQL
ncbi:N-acetylglucosaminyldiphosphoundecaprenol N-acetyl-beta-D-mannosaminyltransferase [Mesorhizobium albiziae]|uniref:N-acetylglucosaminyldiphosphoundecaprenol N-acetyl-beta-D-mannosaminyltransferase n=1 Tax=Neomesorhizobium albiziae TaxID=335020 RepID=A0A1I3XL00_9HYPH|nr:WecB/TagA/CpsF family glycosyltransferase [Mesorhizobium albiziae]GLS30389.1 UDP-N-acetyl-D-mannosamine transferase [Mesorhizobium albiziae]SFK19721.1 N-acetylglucosaminyldiphosphoundecaprenol N-acetyl-beta-D-mannosaminyltransferase [Mesorhizobium albiziae]